ncbi:MAG: hypothetical protein KDB53_07555, partial [Planctomycetes bacterium]|nr:hypothetical protein [Planctomycetota bacterium]
LPVSSDGVVPMNFSVGAMPFYGSVRNGLFAHENGFITFGAPSSLGVASMIDPNAANMSEPAVLVNWANWDLAGTPGIEIYEFGREVRIGWGTAGAAVRHFNDSDQARFECVMIKGNSTGAGDDNAGAIMLDIIQLDAAALNQNGAVVGVTGGMGLDPTPSSRDLGLRQFASGPNGALFGQATLPSLALSVLNVASGGPGLYRNGSGLSGRKLVFLPPSGGGPLGNRPFSIGTRANPDDVASLIGSASLSAAGATTGFPQTLRLLGYFQFLIGTSPLIMPRVFLDPFGAAGVGPVALSIDSIMDSTGFFQGTQPGLNVVPPLPGFRDFEGLSVQLDGPILPVPPAGVVVDLQVVFDNGTTFLLPQAVTINP